MRHLSNPLIIVKVAIFPPAPIDHYLDYLLPDGVKDIKLGLRVSIKVGSQKKLGLVMEKSDHTELEAHRLRCIDSMVDANPIISTDMLKLIRWTADYYHHPIGRVLLQTLPVFFRQGKLLEQYVPKFWFAQEGMDLKQLVRTPIQAQLYEFLLQNHLASESLLDETFERWRPSAKSLRGKGFIDYHRAESTAISVATALSLKQEQQVVLERLCANTQEFSCHLLEGVTGSGKTEVYMQLVANIIQSGKQALVLVPEIGLIAQTLRRFEQRFGTAVAAYHSDMNKLQRQYSWYGACSGDIKIVIATRSGVFIPFVKMGVIIVDEEHDTSYKQNDWLRYHARDLAVKRAQLLGIPVLLGSATPSLESLHHTIEKKYHHHQLMQRIGKAGLPKYEVINLCQQTVRNGLSLRLIEMMRQCLDRREQVLLFLNRRGYAPKVVCHNCGQVVGCPNCDVPLTYHAYNNTLLCHHCGNNITRPDVCRACGNGALQTLGVGTERIESELRVLFPDTQTARIDADSTQGKGELNKRLEAVRDGSAGILVGTQMISKGHHFPNVTLTGIINVDNRLFSNDFRGVERLGQTIVQVAGRSGRGDKPGVVALQTYHPENESLQRLIRHGYYDLSRFLLPLREHALMSPYRFLALLQAESKDKKHAMHFLELAANQINHYAGSELEVLGPIPMALEKRKGFHRTQLLMNASSRMVLHRVLTQVLPSIRAAEQAGKTRWYLDIDPLELE